MAATTIESILEIEASGAAQPEAALHRRWTIAVDRAVGLAVEPIVALLIVVEVVILASGVFSRYVLHSASTWTDELATFLFLWMTMLGAVVAYRRGEHMRLTAVVRAVAPHARYHRNRCCRALCIELIPRA